MGWILPTIIANTLLYKGAKAVKKSFEPDNQSPPLAEPLVTPEAESPTLLPDPMSTASVEAKKRKVAQFYGKQMTRANTVLTSGDKLGG